MKRKSIFKLELSVKTLRKVTAWLKYLKNQNTEETIPLYRRRFCIVVTGFIFITRLMTYSTLNSNDNEIVMTKIASSINGGLFPTL